MLAPRRASAGAAGAWRGRWSAIDPRAAAGPCAWLGLAAASRCRRSSAERELVDGRALAGSSGCAAAAFGPDGWPRPGSGLDVRGRDRDAEQAGAELEAGLLRGRDPGNARSALAGAADDQLRDQVAWRRHRATHARAAAGTAARRGGPAALGGRVRAFQRDAAADRGLRSVPEAAGGVCPNRRRRAPAALAAAEPYGDVPLIWRAAGRGVVSGGAQRWTRAWWVRATPARWRLPVRSAVRGEWLRRQGRRGDARERLRTATACWRGDRHGGVRERARGTCAASAHANAPCEAYLGPAQNGAGNRRRPPAAVRTRRCAHVPAATCIKCARQAWTTSISSRRELRQALSAVPHGPRA